MGRVVGDFGSTISSALVVIGDKLGLYQYNPGYSPALSGRARWAAPRQTSAMSRIGSSTRREMAAPTSNQ